MNKPLTLALAGTMALAIPAIASAQNSGSMDAIPSTGETSTGTMTTTSPIINDMNGGSTMNNVAMVNDSTQTGKSSGRAHKKGLMSKNRAPNASTSPTDTKGTESPGTANYPDPSISGSVNEQ